jgi:hypothetical protein
VRCGTEHAKSLLPGSKDSNELRGILHRRVERPRSHDRVDQPDGGWVPHRLAKLDLFPVEREVILASGMADAVVVREQRLHDGLAPYLTSTRAAGDLRKQLKGPLAGAKSARPRPTSAEITPTSVTFGKSWPFASI